MPSACSESRTGQWALVRDSAGIVRGLITLEDVLEEIVGDIEDEHDVPVPKLKPARRRAGLIPKAASTDRQKVLPAPKEKPK